MKTIPQLFEESVQKYANNPFLKEKKTDKFEAISYIDTRDYIYKFAAGLLSLGINIGDKIALISEGRNDWIISEMGILYAGAVNVPLSVKLIEASEIKFRINHSESRFVIVSQGQASKIKQIKSECPLVEKIIYLDTQESYSEDEFHINDIYKLGEDFLATHGSEFENRWTNLKGDAHANICYTSGTTADPKGIILSHRNYTANVEQACSLMTIPETYTTLFILPLDHSFAHTVYLCFIYKGASIATVQIGKTAMETLKNIPINIREVKPNLILSVPALAKNFRKNIENGIRSKGKVTETLFNIAIKTAYIYNAEGHNKGTGMRQLLKPLLSLFDKTLFSKIRDNFGGEIDFFIGGGAMLDIDIQRFFYAIGTPMMQGYGLTEASPVISANGLLNHKLGSSGRLVNPIQLKIEDENGKVLPAGHKGEIVIKGENVMIGYWRNETATADTIKNGWLHTGDMGYVDQDGYLYVTGRFKCLLIANDGEKYSPEGIEEALTEHISFIDQIMLYNNQSNYTTALLVLNKEAVKRWYKHHSHSHKHTDEEYAKTFLKHLQHEIMNYDKKGKHEVVFPERWLPAAFAILNEPFTEDNRMMNSTLKMVRGKIAEHYTELIDYIYTPEGKDVTNNRNVEVVKNIF